MAENASLDPNLRAFGDPRAKGVRYPSPFFDISQQYVPPTIKELFKWVYYYCTNNSFLGPAIAKMARYPITDLIYEDKEPTVVEYWQTLMNNTLQIKAFNAEVNLDLMSYGNAFVTIFYPFSRFLECPSCKNRVAWREATKKIENLIVKITCKKCGGQNKAKIIDVPYKSIENVRMIRINPEFIDIKYNDSSGRHTYLYSIPDKLKRQLMTGDPDIIEDTPQVFLEAVKQRRKIKLSNQNLFHLKSPTLAGKDMGWGMPRISVALKDLYQYYTMLRGQEAILNEHIVPFDIIFPQASGKMDPYVHTNLTDWRKEIQKQLASHRRDPNYKAILPFPVGHERIGGDGKVMMLTPNMDFSAKTIIGACGIPQEFVYGGTMNWSGSSISLRTLENDFIHHRTQIIQLDIWLVERMRLYLGVPAPKTVRMTDFKMADDVQKTQMMIGAASANKFPWDEIWKEWGRDPTVIKQALEKQAEFEAKIEGKILLAQAEAQAKAQQVAQRYALNAATGGDTAEGSGGQISDEAQGILGDLGGRQEKMVNQMARQLMKQAPADREMALQRLDQQDPKFSEQLRGKLEELGQIMQAASERQNMAAQKKERSKPASKKPGEKKPVIKNVVNMRPLPQQGPPRRQGGI